MRGGTIATLKGFLQGDVQQSVQPGFLRPIDVDQIAQALNLETLGSQRGSEGLPDSASDIFDAVEQAIVQKVESELGWQGGEFINQLRAYSSRLVQFSIHSEFTRLQVAADHARTALRGVSHQAESELGPLRERLLEARAELSAFRSRHRLKRPARINRRPWTAVGLITVLVGIESVLNGVFFAEGARFGLVGGIGIAIGISIVNVIFGFALGLFPARWINRRNLLVKLIGFVLTALGLSSLLFLQVFAAHYRETVAATGQDNVMRQAIERMIDSPANIQDISSVYLMGLGLIFGLAAFWKGCTFDDPYPGYGATARRFEKAQSDYSNTHGDLFGDLEDVKDDVISDLDSGISRIPLFPQSAAAVRTQRIALLNSFRAYEKAVETAANQLLARYRDANRRARSTLPPARFNMAWSLSHSFIENADVRTLLEDAPEPMPNVEASLAELRQLSKAVLTEFESVMSKYPHASQLRQ